MNTNKLINLDILDKFYEKYHLAKLIQDKIENKLTNSLRKFCYQQSSHREITRYVWYHW
jgi:hypothetical protein